MSLTKRCCLIVLVLSSLAPSVDARKLKATRHALLNRDDDPCACQSNGLEKISGGVIDAKDTPAHEKFVARRSESGKVLEYLPGEYGETCQKWEEGHEDCQWLYAPAWCQAKWCYVKKECKEHKDVKQSMYFPGKELYYSYQKCGSLDGYTSEACHAKKKEEKCGDPCAWNKLTNSCQNKLCQCTGDNTPVENPKKYQEKILKVNGKDYGKKCNNWDQKTCPTYEGLSKEEGGADLGLWCCKDWCYVPEECPSAKPNAYGLHYSYYACPDDSEALTTCPWKKAITYDGSPLPLTSTGAKALNRHAKSGANASSACLAIAALLFATFFGAH